MRPAVKPSLRILHSSPVEEKKLGFPFSENGPSAIQGEGATSPFSDLQEWEERGLTTPNVWVGSSTPSLKPLSRMMIPLGLMNSLIGYVFIVDSIFLLVEKHAYVHALAHCYYSYLPYVTRIKKIRHFFS
jgi:hypothetical protein